MSHATLNEAAPIVRRKYTRKSELDSRSIPIPQKPVLKMPGIDESVERDSPIVQVETPLMNDDLAKLAFAEEPMTILIHRSGEKFAPRSTDYIGVNGKGAEMLFKNGWVPIGYLPRGQSVITKRKYVEVLAKSKTDHVTTSVIERDGEDPQNYVERATVTMTTFSVLKDDNPKGAEWLAQLLRQQG